ncbi:hypothetical protein [Xylophilus sp. GOD-11R]|uniref:hypothetical protein n=1 Tax=Xylophilus sp. GOD-11R TaxID=3089814 RepID=UPI00298C4C08|nr:hypothetical protein [Xylophilus sp. GOD-11R]WPB54969.1 hypothetical protein R9X41_12375 [Xylophilus sp. GOD-11R]
MEANIYETLVGALREHWKSHENRYPQRFLLSTEQHRQLVEQRKTGRVALGDAGEPEPDRFFGTPLLVDDASGSTMVTADGQTVSLR